MNKTIKILLVDDDILTLMVQSKLLTGRGYEVFTSQTAVNIFATIDKYAPDIIIMDHDMPVVSGSEAIRQIKGNQRTSTIPVIYFSSVEHLADLAAETGADAYISKSKKTNEMISIIEGLVAH